METLGRFANNVRFSKAKRKAFIAALEKNFGNFTASCRDVAPTHRNKVNPAYSTWKKLMVVDHTFAQEVAEVMERVRDRVSAEITRRAMEGTMEPVFSRGQRAQDGVVAFAQCDHPDLVR